MIADTIDNAARYENLHPLFRAAFAFLRGPGLATLAPGRHEILGADLYVSASFDHGKTRETCRLESHDRYIDIHYLIEGEERIGWKPRASCKMQDGAYDSGRDLRFFSDEPDAFVSCRPGSIAIFFQEDAHMPMISPGKVRKLVVKVKS